MALTIRTTYYRGLPPGQELACSIKEKICTLGRATDCDFVLPDPERVVSNHQATIHLENGTFILTDTSTNGTFLNHSSDAVGRGQTVQLQEGDVLTIGDYECRISITKDVETEPETLDGPDAWPMQKPIETAETSVDSQPEVPQGTPDLPEFESEPLVFPSQQNKRQLHRVPNP